MPYWSQFLKGSDNCRLYIHIARLHQNDGDVDLATESLSIARTHLESARSAMDGNPQSEEWLLVQDLEHHIAELDSWVALGGNAFEQRQQYSAPTPESGDDSKTAGTGRTAGAQTELLSLRIRRRFAAMMAAIRRIRAGL